MMTAMFTNFLAPLLATGSPLEHVVDHPRIQTEGGLWLLTNHMVMMFTAAIIMLIVFPLITRHYRDGKMVPTGSRNFIEALMMFIRNDVAKPVLADETDRFCPLLWTLFFFILICNILGLLPFDALQNLMFNRGGEGHGGHAFHPIYGTATSNFYVTATLATIVFIVIQFNGIKENGFKGWLHHFLGGAPWYLAPVMIPVEIMGMLVKPFALAVRLAANMTAGHILLAVIIGFVPAAWGAFGPGAGVGIGIVSVVSSVLIMVLELFVACLHAYLFTFLTALFISQLIIHHHGDEDHPEEEGHEFGQTHALREDDAHHPKPAHG
jgi:F-type H+-transporting ATPase subunit a